GRRFPAAGAVPRRVPPRRRADSRLPGTSGAGGAAGQSPGGRAAASARFLRPGSRHERMKSFSPDFSLWIRARADHVEHVLDELLPAADQVPARLHEAMRYAVLGAGKRVRAALVYAAGQACAGAGNGVAVEASLDRAAAAVELIHAYSLVHDDLPCMDDATSRRGRP